MRPGFDSAAFRKLARSIDDHSVLEGYIEVLLGDAKQALDDGKPALKAEDFTSIHRIFHTLKPSAATFGLTRVAELCERGEQQIVDGAHDDAAATFKALEEAISAAGGLLERAMAELREA